MLRVIHLPAHVEESRYLKTLAMFMCNICLSTCLEINFNSLYFNSVTLVDFELKLKHFSPIAFKIYISVENSHRVSNGFI